MSMRIATDAFADFGAKLIFLFRIKQEDLEVSTSSGSPPIKAGKVQVQAHDKLQ